MSLHHTAAFLVAFTAGTALAQTGPCCLPDATCATLTVAECIANNGLFFGAGSSCATTNCGVIYPWNAKPLSIPDGSGSSTCGTEAIASIELPFLAGSLAVEASFFIVHPRQGDLTITLERVGGPSVVLIDRPGYPATPSGFTEANFGSGFHNAGRFISTAGVPNRYDNPATSGVSNPTGRWRAEGSLTVFNNISVPAGVWRLRVKDCAAGNTGSIVAFAIKLYGLSGFGAPGTCYVNCDNSTTPPCLNANDFICFLNAFAAGEYYTNCDVSDGYPILNANDFLCFANVYAAGSSTPCAPRP